MTGPLEGVTAIEIGGIGPTPYAGLLLSDLGAEVIRIDRPGAAPIHDIDVVGRGRRSIHIDLKQPEGLEILLRLIRRADLVYEGFRPGVAERLGFGPDVCLALNPRLIYGRATGWGQTGPLAPRAGHDINFLALSGLLHPMGSADRPPQPPLFYLGDYGAGGLMLALGLLAGVLNAGRTGVGQVVDATVVDGAALMSASLLGAVAGHEWSEDRGTNPFGGSAPLYRTYECSDGGYVALGAVEPQFAATLVGLLGLDDEVDWWGDVGEWPRLCVEVAAVVATRTRAEWAGAADGLDVCLTPVLSPSEAAAHDHLVSRSTFLVVEEVLQPAPAPRFSVTPPVAGALTPPAAHTTDVLAECGYSAGERDDLFSAGIVA